MCVRVQSLTTTQVLTFCHIDILGIDILGVDIMGVDILGCDIPDRIRVLSRLGPEHQKPLPWAFLNPAV